MLGEDVIEIIFCYIFYPNGKFMLERIETESYQQYQNRKKKKKRNKLNFMGNFLNKWKMKYYNIECNMNKILQNRCILHFIHTYQQPGRLLVLLNNLQHNNQPGKIGLFTNSPCKNKPGIIGG